MSITNKFRIEVDGYYTGQGRLYYDDLNVLKKFLEFKRITDLEEYNYCLEYRNKRPEKYSLFALNDLYAFEKYTRNIEFNDKFKDLINED